MDVVDIKNAQKRALTGRHFEHYICNSHQMARTHIASTTEQMFQQSHRRHRRPHCMETSDSHHSKMTNPFWWSRSRQIAETWIKIGVKNKTCTEELIKLKTTADITISSTPQLPSYICWWQPWNTCRLHSAAWMPTPMSTGLMERQHPVHARSASTIICDSIRIVHHKSRLASRQNEARYYPFLPRGIPTLNIYLITRHRAGFPVMPYHYHNTYIGAKWCSKCMSHKQQW